MSRRPKFTEELINRWIQEGRGQGELSTYHPWLIDKDIASKGTKSAAPGWKTNRCHHVFSQLELQTLYHFEWLENVVDIREQYPLLPRERTLDIASDLGIRYPVDFKTKVSMVMTTDFYITYLVDGKLVHKAYTVKYCKDLGRRVIEKFEIERVFHKQLGVEWQIITEREISRVIANVIDIIHSRFRLNLFKIPNHLISPAIQFLEDKLYVDTSTPLQDIVFECDQRLGLNTGDSINIVYHMLATKRWHFNIEDGLDPVRPLILR